ncbi:putative oxidoreductase YteT isoform X1 [Phyllopteryx taeniolatus]|uniref:putative oxidoreductase YteT isoform X1 n=1 Tax=Phyllopteryx taeniolatus TaxID=161469 RepID=UPI002AD3112D|nr:putative oxidoreductase YteT isoform X1 [Phyllopteryx taeniolatus]XP_061639713.1 putative oxidoreductase YteT isoform X1 [Phyllopteryx taeniolatus]XP_061639724.1 putative oxidoreductase YteT isoform X1 [Phyllopteryx taeniolatus]XP_061639733.1 putative oxidoreductase YteT isoform X1 [Phyllopteryx taeniolatus]XP_061639744.1 putative oxidoreductase YteT isoform X1 [Phyllopteryx taeniolatus]
MSPLVRVIVVGAGCRGEIYSRYAIIHPDRVQVVGVADPRKFARTKFQQLFNIADENLYEDWRILAEREKCADAVLICTPDTLHKEPAVAFANKGYHVLLEKPMATTAQDCIEIVGACSQSGVMLCVGHVLRYDPSIRKIKELIDSGVIGDVIHIQHFEPVGFCHFAHSFVRGNWRKEAESSFALLAKSCHDIDLIHQWAGARRCLKVTSFGFVSHFSQENKPTGAAVRCLDCSVEDTCPYSASKIYLDRVKKGHTGWPISVICPNSFPDIETVTEALRTGPYGRCVYECDNDVCSNQVVNMEFEGGLTAAFSMVAFTEDTGKRKTAIYGSKGELSFKDEEIRVFDFLTQKATKHAVNVDCPMHFGLSGHAQADYFLIDSFISAVTNNDPSLIASGPEETLQSHLLVFEAERSRQESRVVQFNHSG